LPKEEFSNLYTSSQYTEKHPDYHQKDSPFKWKDFEKCIKKSINNKNFNTSEISSICEIGYGTGGILDNLRKSNLFLNIDNIEGWDINPGAIYLARKLYPDIKFIDKDLFENENFFDLVICADVFEHVENPYQFLKKISFKSKYFLFNIPLEMNLLTMIQGKKILKRTYNSVGHLHFFQPQLQNLYLNCQIMKLFQQILQKIELEISLPHHL
tara:strand:+ start:109 stop:744 length:636 start_codon:yes stop_codon:yes gene_type:complete